MSDYSSTSVDRVSAKGGCLKLAITGAASVQLGDHACREVYIIAENADDVFMAIGDTAVAATNCIRLPQLGSTDGTVPGAAYLRIPIDNTNKLHVIGENGDVVYYMWRN